MRWPQTPAGLNSLLASVRVRLGIQSADTSAPIHDIESLRKAIHAFGTESDQSFTHLARTVGRVSEQMRDLAERSERLDAILQHRDEKRSLNRAYDIYKRSVDLVHASMGVAISDHEQLEVVERSLLKACEAREQLGKNSVVFRILTLETRVEAVKLDHEYQMVFHTVAEAIQQMGLSINMTADAAFGEIENVVRETRSERGRLQEHQLSLHSQAQGSVNTIRRELDKLKAALEPCGAESGSIVELSAEARSVINRVVMSLQAQDIVRQQLEHVSSGFEDIEKHSEQTGILDQAAAVQIRQLATARSRIEEASAGLSSGLGQLGAVASGLYEHFVKMEEAAAAAFGECRLGTYLREELERLAQIAEQSQQSSQRISSLVSRVDAVIKDFSEKVTTQQFEVKLVALNAQIAAARMPGAGALNRLAEETSRVSEEVGVMNTQMTHQLREVVETLQAMKAHADEFQEVIVRDRGDLAAQSTEVIEMIDALQTGVRAETAEVCKNFGTVKDDINELIASFAPARSIAEAFDPCVAFCNQLQVWCEKHPPSDAEIQTYKITNGRYTMESEYRTHEEALNGGKPASTAAPAAAPDNDIELF